MIKVFCLDLIRTITDVTRENSSLTTTTTTRVLIKLWQWLKEGCRKAVLGVWIFNAVKIICYVCFVYLLAFVALLKY